MITKDEIKAKVASNPEWATRAIVALYYKQTADERYAEATREYNYVGFNAFDAGILTSFAIQVLAGRRLSEKQLGLAYKKLPKYAGQLLAIAQEKA